MAETTPSRHEKSLGLLTTKFVSLLQEAKDGVLDLKVVSVIVIFVASYLNMVIQRRACQTAFSMKPHAHADWCLERKI